MSVEQIDRLINYAFVFLLGWLACEYLGPFI